MAQDESTAGNRSLDATTGKRATPTGTRHVVLAFAVLLAVITYVDRVCISQAAPQMREDLGLSKEQMGWA